MVGATGVIVLERTSMYRTATIYCTTASAPISTTISPSLTLLHLHYPDYHSPSTQPQKPPNPQPPPLPRIQLRPHIQIEIPDPPPPPIKINHILHLLSLPPFPLRTPLNNPIMPIKRPLIPQPRIPPRPRRQPSTLAPKAPQPRSPTPLIPPPTAQFPTFYLRPSALVDGVVDGYDERHVFGAGRVRFATESVEEHAFGGVDPVSRSGGEGRGRLRVWGGGVGGCGAGGGGGAGDGGDGAV